MGWSDILQIPGAVRLAPGIQPYRLLQMYCDRVKVQWAGEQGVLFVFGAYSGICCQQTAAGILSNDGKAIKAGDEATPFLEWKKRGE